MNKEKERENYRKFIKKVAKENGGFIEEGQIYSRRKPEHCLQIYSRTRTNEERRLDALETLRSLEKIFKLKHQVLDDYTNGIVDVIYLDSALNGHVLYLKDDDRFLEAAEEIISKTDAMPFLGIKWDGQHSPVFMCITDTPDCLGKNDFGAPVMSSGSETGGITCRADYRYYQLGVYFWVNGRLCDDYVEFDTHDGVLYPVEAFPYLQEKDGIKVDDIIFI